jgi:hypothetical protein
MARGSGERTWSCAGPSGGVRSRGESVRFGPTPSSRWRVDAAAKLGGSGSLRIACVFVGPLPREQLNECALVLPQF